MHYKYRFYAPFQAVLKMGQHVIYDKIIEIIDNCVIVLVGLFECIRGMLISKTY